jgi:phage-related minor tail protein
LAEVGALRITLGLDSIDFTQGMRNVNQRLTALNSEFRAISAGAGRFDNSLETLRARSDVLTRSMQTHQRKVEELRRRYEESKATKGEDAAETVRLAAAYNNSIAAMRGTEQQLNRVTQQIEEQTNSFSQLEREVNANVNNITRQMRVLESGYAAAAGGADDLAGRQQNLTQSMALQQSRVAELTRLHEESVRANGADAEATQELQIRLNRATQAMNETERQLNQTNEEIEDQTNRWKNLSRTMGTVGTTLSDTGTKMRETGQNLTTSLTLPLAGFAVAAGKFASDFDSSAGKIGARLGLTAEQAKELGATAEDLWKNGFGESVDAAGEAIVQVKNNMVGLNQADLKRVTESAYILADAFGIEIAESTSLADNLMAQFSLNSEQAFDAITTGFQNGLNYGDDFADTLREYGPIFAGMGMDINDTLSFLESAQAAGFRNLDVAADTFKEFSLLAQEGGDDFIGAVKAMGKETQALYKGFKDGKVSGEDLFYGLANGLDNIKDPQDRFLAGVATMGTLFEDNTEQNVKNMSYMRAELTTLEGSTKKAGDALYDNFGARLQSVWRNAQSSLKPIGDDLIDIAEDVLPKLADSVGEITGAFANMSPEGQKTALAVAGIAAAAGPVIMGVGFLTSGIGLLTKGLGAAVGFLGGGAGLTGVLTALTGPVGWIAAGLGIATVATIGYMDATKKKTEATVESIEKSFEVVEAQQKEIQSNDELIKKYDDLKNKNKLSNDEMLRFLDIQSEINSTVDPDKLVALKDEQVKLQEKSGLTNDEMKNFLDYNDQIIEKAPNTTKAISDQGNAYALNSSELQKVNAEKLESLKIDAEKAINNTIEKETNLLNEQKEAVQYIKDKEIERQTAYDNINTVTGEIKDKEEEIVKLKEDTSKHGQEVLAQAQLELKALQDKKEREETNLSLTIAEIQAKQESLELTREDLKKLDEQKFKYEQIILAQVGLTAEKGKGLATIDSELMKLDVQKLHLKALHEAGKLNTSEYQEQVGKIDAQIGKLQAAQTELRNVNELAGKTIYKSIQLSTNPSIDEFERRITKPGTKVLNITTSGGGRALGGYATGTRNSPEGLALVGEKGPELMYLPTGARIIPNDDTESILRNWNIPMMASGGVTLTDGMAYVGERGREIVDLRGAMTSPLPSNSNAATATKQPAIIQIVTPDKRGLAEWIVDDITEFQEFNLNRFR